MEFLTEYNLTGLVIGIATFLIIGLFHPLVVKGEYYLGVRCWWGFPRDGDRGDRRVGGRAPYPVVHPAGRVGRLVALVDRRTVRTASARGQRLVPSQPQAAGEITRTMKPGLRHILPWLVLAAAWPLLEEIGQKIGSIAG